MNIVFITLWGTPTVGCFDSASPDLCYVFSRDATDNGLQAAGWPGESTYFQIVHPPTFPVVPVVVAQELPPVAAVPEPSTYALLCIGLVTVAMARRLKRQTKRSHL